MYLLAERPSSNIAAGSEFLAEVLCAEVRRINRHARLVRGLLNSLSHRHATKPAIRRDVLNLLQDEFSKQGWIASDDLLCAKLEGNLRRECGRNSLCPVQDRGIAPNKREACRTHGGATALAITSGWLSTFFLRDQIFQLCCGKAAGPACCGCVALRHGLLTGRLQPRQLHFSIYLASVASSCGQQRIARPL